MCSLLLSLKVLPKSILYTAFSFVLLNSDYTGKLLYLFLHVPHLPRYVFFVLMFCIFHMLFYKPSFKYFIGIQIHCISISNSYKRR